MVQRGSGRQQDYRDPVLDGPTVLGFARRHLPSARAVTEIDETGGEARAYVIDGAYIFKTQRPHRVRARTSIEKAVFYQQVIAKEAPELSVPRVLGYGREGDIEYVLETRIPGVAVRTVELTGEARRTVLVELGRTLRRLHSLDLAQFEASGLFPGDKDGLEVRKRIEASLRQSSAAIAAQPEFWPLSVSLDVVVERALESVKDQSRAALHSNPGPEHVFIDPGALSFQGLIDFGDAYISHPALDMPRWTAPTDRAALIRGYADAGRIDDSFLGSWNAVLVGGILAMMARFPERRDAFLGDLRGLVSEL